MPRIPEAWECTFCPPFLNLSFSVSKVLSEPNNYILSVCFDSGFLISRCAGAAFTKVTNESSGGSCGDLRNINSPNSSDRLILLTIIANVLSILVSILRLLEMMA